MSTNEGHWLTIKAAAETLGRPERTIRRWATDGKLPADRSGPVILVDIAGHTAATGPATTAKVTTTADEMATLRAENETLRAVLAEVRSERDYLRQAHAATVQSVALLTERAGERPRRFRWPWQRRKG